MKKLFLLLILLFPFSVYSLEYPTLNSKRVEIYDLEDQKILYEIGSQDKVSIASLTKIATTITAIESIQNLEETVTITNSILKTVSWEASVAGLKAGDKLTYKDLLYASMLPSGADATNAIAISISGSVPNFVEKMNEFVKRIGLTNTHFVNVTGLDENNHYSTLDEVRKLLEYALKNPTFREIYTTKEYQLTNGKVVKSTLYKYNASSTALNKILGSKTGYTIDAGYCLSALSNINGHEVITIVQNAGKEYNTYFNLQDTETLINFLENHYQEEILVENKKLIKTIPIDLSSKEQYKVYSNQDIKKYLPSDYDKSLIKIKYNGLEQLNYKNHKGDSIGKVLYYYNKELLQEQEIILDMKIDLSIQKVIERYYLWIIGTLTIIISTIILIIVKKKKRK